MSDAFMGMRSAGAILPAAEGSERVETRAAGLV